MHEFDVFAGHLRGRRAHVGRALRSPSASRSDGAIETYAVGCDARHAFPGRLDHEAVHGDPRRSGSSISKRRPGSGPPTSGSATCSRTRAASTASCRARPGAASATATTRWQLVAELRRCDASWASRSLVVREHRLLARRAAARASAPVPPTRRRSPSTSSRRRAWRRPRSASPTSPARAATRPGAPYPRARRPSGGLVSNVPDLLRFGEWLLARAGLAPDARRARQAGRRRLRARPVRRAGRRRRGVGARGLLRRLPVARCSLVPDRGAVFVGLTNSAAAARKALYELEDAFFERVLGARRRRRRRSSSSRDDVLEALRRARTRTATTSRSRSTLSAGGLVVTLDGRRAFAARPIGERTFEVAGRPGVRDRFDFPLDGFARFGSRLAARVA